MVLQLSQKIEKSFFLIIASIPIFFIIGSAILNISIFLLNIFFFIHIFINKNFMFFEENKKYFILIVIFLIYQILNNLINQNYIYFDKSIYYVRFITLPMIFKYFFQRTEINFNNLSRVYLFLILFVIFDLIFQFHFDVNIFGFKPGLYNIEENLYERYAGVFNQELILGSYLSSIGFLCICLFYFFNYKNKNVFFCLLGILFFAIFLTGERSSLLNLLISIFFIFLLVKEFRKSLIIIFLFIFIISSIGINFSETLKLRYFDYPIKVLSKKTFKDSDNKEIYFSNIKVSHAYSEFINSTHWGMHYRTAGAMFLEKPINGFGFKQFRIKCRDFKYLFANEKNLLERAATTDGCSTHPHHYFLELLSEQGIIGLAIFFSFIIYILKDSFNNINNKTYLLIIFSIVIGIIFPIKPTGSIISTWFSSILWIMLSYTYIKNMTNKKNKVKL